MTFKVVLFAAFGLVVTVFALLGTVWLQQKAHVANPSSCGLTVQELGKFVSVPAGSFVKSDQPVYPEEGSAVRIHVAPFFLLAHEVTNSEFQQFVQETGYVTDAEQSREASGSALFSDNANPNDRRTWWHLSNAASWKTPEGDNSSIAGRPTHPVTHVSLRDAKAYATWAGGRLPYEVEWEYAASLGLPDPNRPDSGAFDDSGNPIANVWNGIFPVNNTIEDGHFGTAPVGCFDPSSIGAFDMIGNVWEWTQSPFGGTPQFTIKGGSFLCSDSFCRRFRPAANEAQDANFSTQHIGFRIVKDLP